jgi:hypothetical protein
MAGGLKGTQAIVGVRAFNVQTIGGLMSGQRTNEVGMRLKHRHAYCDN